MFNNIYISTSAFKNKSLKAILELCSENGLTNIELGPTVLYSKENISFVLGFKRKRNMRFLVHNYFPPPKDDFVLNLASNDHKVAIKSKRLCREAIDLSVELGAPFYSVHAGFAFHAAPQDLGRSLINLPRTPYPEAYRIFAENIVGLAGYAAKKRVKLAVENNVIFPSWLINGENKILLLADLNEAADFYRELSLPILHFLVDLGHLKISSAVLRFDAERALQAILPHTVAFHLSDNNGAFDQHLPFDGNIWFRDILADNDGKAVIIEAHNLDIEEIRRSCRIVNDMLGSDG